MTQVQQWLKQSAEVKDANLDQKIESENYFEQINAIKEKFKDTPELLDQSLEKAEVEQNEKLLWWIPDRIFDYVSYKIKNWVDWLTWLFAWSISAYIWKKFWISEWFSGEAWELKDKTTKKVEGVLDNVKWKVKTPLEEWEEGADNIPENETFWFYLNKVKERASINLGPISSTWESIKDYSEENKKYWFLLLVWWMAVSKWNVVKAWAWIWSTLLKLARLPLTFKWWLAIAWVATLWWILFTDNYINRKLMSTHVWSEEDLKKKLFDLAKDKDKDLSDEELEKSWLMLTWETPIQISDLELDPSYILPTSPRQLNFNNNYKTFKKFWNESRKAFNDKWLVFEKFLDDKLEEIWKRDSKKTINWVVSNSLIDEIERKIQELWIWIKLIRWSDYIYYSINNWEKEILAINPDAIDYDEDSFEIWDEWNFVSLAWKANLWISGIKSVDEKMAAIWNVFYQTIFNAWDALRNNSKARKKLELAFFKCKESGFDSIWNLANLMETMSSLWLTFLVKWAVTSIMVWWKEIVLWATAFWWNVLWKVWNLEFSEAAMYAWTQLATTVLVIWAVWMITTKNGFLQSWLKWSKFIYYTAPKKLITATYAWFQLIANWDNFVEKNAKIPMEKMKLRIDRAKTSFNRLPIDIMGSLPFFESSSIYQKTFELQQLYNHVQNIENLKQTILIEMWKWAESFSKYVSKNHYILSWYYWFTPQDLMNAAQYKDWKWDREAVTGKLDNVKSEYLKKIEHITKDKKIKGLQKKIEIDNNHVEYVLDGEQKKIVENLKDKNNKIQELKLKVEQLRGDWANPRQIEMAKLRHDKAVKAYKRKINELKKNPDYWKHVVAAALSDIEIWRMSLAWAIENSKWLVSDIDTKLNSALEQRPTTNLDTDDLDKNRNIHELADSFRKRNVELLNLQIEIEELSKNPTENRDRLLELWEKFDKLQKSYSNELDYAKNQYWEHVVAWALAKMPPSTKFINVTFKWSMAIVASVWIYKLIQAIYSWEWEGLVETWVEFAKYLTPVYWTYLSWRDAVRSFSNWHIWEWFINVWFTVAWVVSDIFTLAWWTWMLWRWAIAAAKWARVWAKVLSKWAAKIWATNTSRKIERAWRVASSNIRWAWKAMKSPGINLKNWKHSWKLARAWFLAWWSAAFASLVDMARDYVTPDVSQFNGEK